MNEEAITRDGPQSQKKLARRLFFHSIIFSFFCLLSEGGGKERPYMT
jgi:hypothetical protein